ncbi:hypothetical protein GH5_05071 [Leishmania sp. Ghana 2012 LV757]|uniref:hypothetical protein n=1 Tax=Leishmania sp. Ghana 2012 LV757 TaxID=2803181 RepID=UPI001B5F3FD8|nr:hypothetical protein GH5_05071 [Leishmania sp. Ghana 2012 LV757]
MHQATTAATASMIDAEGVRNVDEEAQTNLVLAETYLYGDEYSPPEIGAFLSNAEASSKAVACTPMPPRRISDGAATPPAQVRAWTVTQDRKTMSTTGGVLDAPAPPLLSVSPDCFITQCASARRASARAPVRRQTPPSPPQPAQRESKVWGASAFQPPEPSTPSPLQPSLVSDERIFGIRCFAGWEQICIVTEKYRPSVTEVGMAQRGLQVLLRQSKNAVPEV